MVALIAFPVLAWIAAAGLPVEPRPQAPRVVTSGGDGDASSLRQVPVFEDAPDLAAALAGPSQMRDALRAGMADVLDPPAVTALLRLVESDETVTIKGGESVDPLTVPYPYRYPAIERLLPAEFADPARANDLGALLILAAGGFEGESLYAPFPNAGFAAFAVLDRARSGDACAPQLNLAFLLSADTNPRDDDVAREYELAADRCGGDPTPLWLLAQFQSQRAFIRDNADRPGQKLEREDRLQRPFDTVEALQRSHPGLAAAWAAEADAELRIAYQMDPLQPFGSRQRFRRALALYQAARRLDNDPELAAGEARALAGLHLYRRAADGPAGRLGRPRRDRPGEGEVDRVSRARGELLRRGGRRGRPRGVTRVPPFQLPAHEDRPRRRGEPAFRGGRGRAGLDGRGAGACGPAARGTVPRWRGRPGRGCRASSRSSATSTA